MTSTLMPRKARPAKPAPRKRKRPRNLLAQAKHEFREEGLDWSYWVRNRSDVTAVLAGCRPIPSEGDLKVRFFEERLVLSTTDGPRPFKLDSWQEHDIIRPLFAWGRPAIGDDPARRRFDSASIWIPQGNGKTTLAAGITAILLCADRGIRCKVYSAANDRSQASYIYDALAEMGILSPSLRDELIPAKSTKSITHIPSGSIYKALSSEAAGQEGLKPHGLVIDEIHAFRDQGRKLVAALATTLDKDIRSLRVDISTAGQMQAGIGWEEYQKAEAIADGKNVDEWNRFVYIRAAPMDADWTDEAVWRAANPAIGSFLSIEKIRAKFNAARKNPKDEILFRQRRLNQWTAASIDFVPPKVWASCGRDVPLADLKGKRCWGGLDMSHRTDTTSFVLSFEIEPGLPYLVPFIWITRFDKSGLPRTDIDDYIAWDLADKVTVSQTNVIPYLLVRAKINALHREFQIERIGCDPAFAGQMMEDLIHLDGINVHEHKQNPAQFTESTLDFQARAISGALAHDGNPIAALQLQACSLKVTSADLVQPTRPKGSKWKIDSVVAAIMAHNMFLTFKDKPRPGSELMEPLWV